ncbi:MAG: T9SS type A sorting domain-containing protein [Calditrichae bacterium]|nr:T9SS type A sorting domain-containing protein [Calditrichota bacterium]MCB9057789.1 T9SS type A sorting domain-containing protein [Calditrichia bacterium]
MQVLKKILFSLITLFITSSLVYSQESVDVTFRYQGAAQTYLVGEFNSWNNSSWPMTYSGIWTRTERLEMGTYNYKFYTGVNPWPNDPLNHHVNTSDNNNSLIYVKNPTIYHFLPNNRTGFVEESTPTITVYLYPKVGTIVDTASLVLKVDENVYSHIGSYYSFSTKQLVYPVQDALADGSHKAILTVGENSDSVTFVVQAKSTVLSPLPEYAEHGVTLPSVSSNDSVTFRLRVPGVNSVALKIAQEGQNPATGDAILMRKDPDSDNWWINLKLSEGGYEYVYQTDLGGSFYDPWGKWNGTYGSRFYVGSAGLTADDYEWHSVDYEKPEPERLIIYEMNVSETGGGYFGLSAGQAGFYELSQLMAHFDSLGINAIELMPVMDFGSVGTSGFSWGYDLNSYFALEPSYGTPYDFKALVDSAHTHGIAVLLDVVYNHLNDPGPLWMMQPDFSKNPYFKSNDDLRYNEDQLFFFKDLDHWTDETQEIVYKSLKMWIDEYRIDGFRYDFTQGIGWDLEEPDYGILGWADKIDADYDGKIYQIAEHLPESPALIYYSGLTGGWHDSYHDEVFDEARFKNTTLSDFESKVIDLSAYPGNDTPSSPTKYANRTEPVNANNNHDEQSLIYEMTNFQGVSMDDAIVRDKLYATLMFTSLGIPMLWEGQEFAESRGWSGLDGADKLSYRPVQWNLLNTDSGTDHFQYYRSLIHQRRDNPALYRGELRKLYKYNTEKVMVWGFEDNVTDKKIMCVVNFSSGSQSITNVPWLSTGTWYSIFDTTAIVIDANPLPELSIDGFTALVYSNKPDSIALSIAEPLAVPSEFSLSQNYPNPFNPTTTIEYSINKPSEVEIIIYDLQGRRIQSLLNKKQNAGSYSVNFTAENLASGIYYYTFKAGSFIQTRKMVVLK